MTVVTRMTQDELKKLVGCAALGYIVPGAVVGVGSGSTANFFIEALGSMKDRIAGAVASSVKSEERLRMLGIRIFDANEVKSLPVYIDGADEIDVHGNMTKGGCGALTREKIVADMAEKFVCIVDESKAVPVLGRYPLPVEVIPMAQAQIARRLRGLGGDPVLRWGVLTDNGNVILDVAGLRIADPLAMENEITLWPGVVTVGLFARNSADVCLLSTPQGVRALNYEKRFTH